MVHLSKKYLDKTKLLKLYQLFFEIISRTYDKSEFYEVLNDFISPLEQIMIAKRIAIVYLLTKKIGNGSNC